MQPDLKKAIELQKSGNLEGAVNCLQKAIRKGYKEPQVYYFLGSILNSSKRYDEALKYLLLAVKAKPKDPSFWYSYGNALSNLKQDAEAAIAFEHSLALKPDDVFCLVNLSLAYQRLDRYDEAGKYALKATQLSPKEKNAWLTLIAACGHMRQFDEGIRAADNALFYFSKDPLILHMKGNILTAADRVGEALEIYKEALVADPTSTKVLNSIGHVLQFKHPFESIVYHQKALELEPNSPDSLHGIGTGYLKVGSPVDAVPYFLDAIKNGGSSSDVYDALVLAAQYLESTDEREIFQLHLDWAELFAKKYYPENPPTLDESVRAGKNPIRLAFISPDFRDHSVSRFMTSLIRNAESSGLDIYCYSDVINPGQHSNYLESLGGVWKNTIKLPDGKLAELVREDRIDVLIDLAGHTGFNRLFLFARKVAPIQVSWLGYPNTTGLNTIDFRFSDEIADPEGVADELSSERIIRLKDGFHCFEPPMELPEVVDTPCLEKGYLTFGSFNNQAKINVLTIDRWVMLLNAIPNSKLLIKNSQIGNKNNQTHWYRVFELRGIQKERLEFVGFCDQLADHYACYDRIDIGVDTFPYNGTTTTCEALWMGVPVLTIKGDSQRARTGASLLTHAGLEEWVVDSEQQWVERACYWNAHREELNELRVGLRKQVSDSPIGDGPRFAQKFYDQIKSLVLS